MSNAVSPTMAGTVSGRYVELTDPGWRDIDLADVAHGLSQARRWAGQARRAISVAEHSLLVGRLVPAKYRLAAILHDGHEFIIGDLTSPVAKALAAYAGTRVGWALATIKHRHDVAIARRVVEDFAPVGAIDFEGADREARWLVVEMRSEPVKAADALALRYEDAVRRRDALLNLDAFGECAARLIPPYAPDEGEMAARWLGEVKALTVARFAGRVG